MGRRNARFCAVLLSKDLEFCADRAVKVLLVNITVVQIRRSADLFLFFQQWLSWVTLSRVLCYCANKFVQSFCSKSSEYWRIVFVHGVSQQSRCCTPLSVELDHRQNPTQSAKLGAMGYLKHIELQVGKEWFFTFGSLSRVLNCAFLFTRLWIETVSRGRILLIAIWANKTGVFGCSSARKWTKQPLFFVLISRNRYLRARCWLSC